MWESTGTKDPQASDILVSRPWLHLSRCTLPETTLKALATHSELAELLTVDGGNCEEVLAELGPAGIDRRCFGCAAADRGS